MLLLGLPGAIALLVGCGRSPSVSSVAVQPSIPQNLDRSCDVASFPSLEWTACETANYARANEALIEQLRPHFAAALLQRTSENLADWLARASADPSWLDLRSGNTALLPVCTTGAALCVGDPFRYPQVQGADGTVFYDSEAKVLPVVFYDRQCARLSGRLWIPNEPKGRLPGIVVTNGSFQAPEAAYWWAAQALVRAGYGVLTYDPRGQGRSDQQAPDLQQGSNLNAKVFWEGQVDAIDFFRSSPAMPYPHEAHCTGTYPTTTAAFNPAWEHIDPERLGIAGHSLGAIGVSVVQGYGAPGAAAWPGLLDQHNPVDAAVAWDSLVTPGLDGFAPLTNYPAPAEVIQVIGQIGTQGNLPAFAPRVPALSFNADYGLVPTPYLLPPDPDNHKRAFAVWQAAAVPTMVVSLQGTTHLDYSLLPGTPATSWCPDAASASCTEGFAQPAIIHYTVAWFDRWLKRRDEPGFEDADHRLLDDGGPQGAVKFSFRYRTARDYPDRGGHRQHCEDVRAGCTR